MRFGVERNELTSINIKYVGGLGEKGQVQYKEAVARLVVDGRVFGFVRDADPFSYLLVLFQVRDY